ncbi:AraC family transcriptional regulator [Bryobacter aggregatus]|uniref:AraC family transcriptional regulator n=1 Tax=Bryobacter aggregatus TaxID=360054 RepID=UPI0004E1983A|nr:AraC family transcriptional regulator [Bryobacter aggregatus]
MKNQKTDALRVAEQVAARRCELAQKISQHMGSAEKMTTVVPGLTLHQRTGPTPPCVVAYVPGLIVMAQGRKRVELGPKTFFYNESHYLLTSLDLPSISQVIEASPERPALAFALKLELPIVREILMREEVPLPDSPADSSAMTTGEVTAELLNACCRLMDLLATPKDAPFLGGLIQREIIYRVLQQPEGARLRAITTHGEQSHRTAQAIAWLKANYEKPLKVEDLAQMARMGVSTFHHHFREMTAMSPVQYQKQLRLQAARAQMLTDDLDASSAAIKVGYESVSQFNREYSRLFGLPPMRDIRALRSSDST